MNDQSTELRRLLEHSRFPQDRLRCAEMYLKGEGGPPDMFMAGKVYYGYGDYMKQPYYLYLGSYYRGTATGNRREIRHAMRGMRGLAKYGLWRKMTWPFSSIKDHFYKDVIRASEFLAKVYAKDIYVPQDEAKAALYRKRAEQFSAKLAALNRKR